MAWHGAALIIIYSQNLAQPLRGKRLRARKKKSQGGRTDGRRTADDHDARFEIALCHKKSSEGGFIVVGQIQYVGQIQFYVT